MNYLEAAKIAINCFSDSENWDAFYGGNAWNNIAKSLVKIISYNNDLQVVDKNSPNAIQIMRMLVIELNVFDGLSHNTASIMRNLISQEMQDTFGNDGAYRNGEWFSSYDLALEEFDKVKKMMDSKELKNSIDVYTEIEDTLKESGDIYKYKDYNTKIRNSKEYLDRTKRHDPKQKQLELISEIKKIQPAINNCLMSIPKINALINKVNDIPWYKELGEDNVNSTLTIEIIFSQLWVDIFYQLKNDLNSIRENLRNMIETLEYLSDKEKKVILNIDSKIHRWILNIILINDRMEKSVDAKPYNAERLINEINSYLRKAIDIIKQVENINESIQSLKE